ncbi:MULTISPECIES: response regulator transcription factor [unclassified Saccharopolyspora]|uniref:response regulator transcription factor n=1 Tax=unclassified Saccharopolyspora TaxID=2646250 RepID=UPI001CD66A35|nr:MULTISPECIES: response regulator transcription factor [unclassified Saccharopolyspora]MCA1188039.1 response regulator transcription factor [Saccharopolyspora sp. 6T]MCA1195997.1 response regulator transcription factor [Saccharopolyspora sp. 6V]MCA1228290.1 response regulator transcription factor [Saccharopolyspora sp. 6M]MCA1281547.1 response regulator transcription factor [Saccharopolyspora sp. 7B]
MRVLVVEDERRVAEALRTGLEAEGWAVDVTGDGLDALRLAADTEYAAILLDIMLPGLNGYRVCERLRAAEDWTPIIMLTAKDGEYDEADALDSGADDYVTKPFSYVVLLARLRNAIRRRATARPPLLRVGDLVLDPARRSCARGDQDISLTSKEFAVLELLARGGGQVVSKRRLLESGWDFAADPDVNLVEVHISALRRKIDNPFGRRSIRTVRGHGYRLVPDGGAEG